MNRYKFIDADIPKVKKFLKSGKGVVPNWAKKYRDELTVKGNTIYYQDKEIVTQEKISDFLRDKIMSKDATIPFGRDSAYYKLKCVGIPRRKLMDWLRSQKTLAETKPKLAKPKVAGGKKYKKITLESDLVFVRRQDVIKANKKFQNDELKNETYIICTTEINSGLTKLDYLQNKSESNSALEKHIKWFMKKFKLKNGKQLSLQTDAGSEYSLKRIRKLIPDYKFVSSGKYVERKNSQIQANLFRILKNRQAVTLKSAVEKAQNMANNTLNRIHKKTPLEVVEEKSNDDIIKQHNATRKSYQKGDTRKEFEIGDYVRVQADEKTLAKMDYKVYKSKTFEDKVRQITHKTKKSIPTKYRVGRKWYLQDRLMKAQPVDQKSELLKKKRDLELKQDDEQKHKDQLDYAKALDVVKEEEKKTKVQGILRKGSKFVKKLQAMRKKDEEALQAIEDAEEEYQQEQEQKKKPKLPKLPKPKLKKKIKKKSKTLVEYQQEQEYKQEQEFKKKKRKLPKAAQKLKKKLIKKKRWGKKYEDDDEDFTL